MMLTMRTWTQYLENVLGSLSGVTIWWTKDTILTEYENNFKLVTQNKIWRPLFIALWTAGAAGLLGVIIVFLGGSAQKPQPITATLASVWKCGYKTHDILNEMMNQEMISYFDTDQTWMFNKTKHWSAVETCPDQLMCSVQGSHILYFPGNKSLLMGGFLCDGWVGSWWWFGHDGVQTFAGKFDI